jgi:hypothetical protein
MKTITLMPTQEHSQETHAFAKKKPKKPYNSGCGKRGCEWAGSAKMIPLNIPLAKAA